MGGFGGMRGRMGMVRRQAVLLAAALGMIVAGVGAIESDPTVNENQVDLHSHPISRSVCAQLLLQPTAPPPPFLSFSQSA